MKNAPGAIVVSSEVLVIVNKQARKKRVETYLAQGRTREPIGK